MSGGASSSCSAVGDGAGAGAGGGEGSPASSGVVVASPCGACKFLRRKCNAGCVFAPYFDSDQGHFAAVHKVFGASNIAKLLHHIPEQKRLDAVVTICFEAQSRVRDPVYGCVGHIFTLQQQVTNLQAELSCLQTYLAVLETPSSSSLLPPFPEPPQISIWDLPPPATCLPTTIDLAALFDPLVHPPPPPPPPPPQQQQPQRPAPESPSRSVDEREELQAVARELIARHRSRRRWSPMSASSPINRPSNSGG